MLYGRLARITELSVLGVPQPSLSDHRTARMPSTQHVSPLFQPSFSGALDQQSHPHC